MTNATNTKPAAKHSRNTAGKSSVEPKGTRASAISEASDAEVTPRDGAEAIAERPAASAAAKPQSKTALVLALLQRPDGASIDQLVEATGWLPHTTRAALTGLKKKGHAVVRTKQGDVSVYSLAA